MEDLELFIQRIEYFDEMSASEQIPYFAYYLTKDEDIWITSKDITACFEALHLAPYSNIATFINRNISGSKAIFLKSKQGFKLSRYAIKDISSKIGEVSQIIVNDELLPLSILQNTRYYLEKNAYQMCACYETGLYDASLVMMRKLVETLIIECFERYGIADRIKDDTGTFYYLSRLIPLFVNCDKWNASRNLKTNILKLKQYGDLSAHNRRFIAHKKDIDDFKFELRQVIQEIVLIIDYPNWIIS